MDRRSPTGRFDATSSIRHLPHTVYAEPVEAWKRQALANLTLGQGGAEPGPRLALGVKVGFVLLVMTAGAPLGVVGWAVTLVTFLGVFFAQELPSVLWARSVGRSARVVLSARGSKTEVTGAPLGEPSAFVLALLGSLANLAVAFALWQLVQRGAAGRAAPLISSAAFVHAAWGAAQALPLSPFHAGGAIARRLRRAARFAFAALSFVVIVVLDLWVLRAPGFPIYFSSFVLGTVAAGATLGRAFNELRDERAGVTVLAAAAAAHLERAEPEQAMDLARRALASSFIEQNRTNLYKTLAWAAIGKRDPFIAHGALQRLPAEAIDVHLVAAYLACCNRAEEAVELLQEARRDGQPSAETSKLLVDLLFQGGRDREALAIAEADRPLYPAQDWQAIETYIGSKAI